MGKSIQQEVTDVIKRENNKKVFGTKEKTENLSHICGMSKQHILNHRKETVGDVFLMQGRKSI